MVKSQLTKDDMHLEFKEGAALLYAAGKCLLIFEPDGDIERVMYAKNPIFPTDIDGKIIIK